MSSKLFNLCVWAASVLVGSIFVATLWRGEERETVAVWRQPQHTNYNSFDPYVLVLEAATPRFSLFGGRTQFALRIFKAMDHDADSVMYVFHELAITPLSSHPVDEFASESRVNWTQQGLEFVAPSGHRVFFPASTFTGGH